MAGGNLSKSVCAWGDFNTTTTWVGVLRCKKGGWTNQITINCQSQCPRETGQAVVEEEANLPSSVGEIIDVFVTWNVTLWALKMTIVLSIALSLCGNPSYHSHLLFKEHAALTRIFLRNRLSLPPTPCNNVQRRCAVFFRYLCSLVWGKTQPEAKERGIWIELGRETSPN